MNEGDVRRARPSELAAVLELAVAFYAEDGFTTPRSQLRDNLAVLLTSDDARVAVASERQTNVGFAITTMSFGLEQGPIAELEDLYVQPAHRGTGIASALIDDSANWRDHAAAEPWKSWSHPTETTLPTCSASMPAAALSMRGGAL
jgi:ribosomal protein S18 acetylase RimI-like enzyme